MPILIVLLLSAQAAFADCSKFLEAASWHPTSEQVQLAPGMAASLKRVHMSRKHFFEVVRGSDYEPLDSAPGRVWMLIFERNPSLGDRGYVLEGERIGDRFVADRLRFSDHRSEAAYFHGVAAAKNVEPRMVMLKNNLMKCRNIMIRANTQVKLWFKHRLRIKDVVDVLDSPDIEPAEDDHSSAMHSRFRFLGTGPGGRLIRSVIEVHPDCDHRLVTAFEERAG